MSIKVVQEDVSDRVAKTLVKAVSLNSFCQEFWKQLAELKITATYRRQEKITCLKMFKEDEPI